MDDKKLDNEIEALLEGMPNELKDSVVRKVDFYKTKSTCFTNEEILKEAKERMRLEMLAYLDRRTYLRMYNRKFVEHKLYDSIVSVVSNQALGEGDLYGIARINFDLNGLKALNDLGGHEAGNQGLKLFADALRAGETTSWLKDQGIKVMVSAEGGDESGMLLIADKDLRDLATEIVEKYEKEINSLDAGDLINFQDSKIQESMSLLGITDEVPEDFKFELSTSIGIAFLGDALAYVAVEESDDSYEQIVKTIINKMFEIADKRGRVHKSAYKEELGKTNPILSGLYARMSREVIHLEKKINELEEKLKEQ